MVSISVNDRELFVPSDTQVVIEQHNAVFDADNIASEIVWTFDLPAAPNDTILNNVTHEHVSCYKEYSCKIAYDGMQIASGKLYVQQVSSDTLMCGIVLNNLHQWGNRKLKDNALPTDVISDESTPGIYQHFKNWLAYLKETLAEDSRIKFPLFVSDGWSKSNKGYGYYAGHVSPLIEQNDEEADRNYVNRVIFDKNNNVDDRDDYDSNGQLVIPGNTPFNKILIGNDEHQNGHTMAPAIRLVWLLQEIFGGRIIGNFINDIQIARLFIQSLNSCDNNKWHTNSKNYLRVTGHSAPRDVNPAYEPIDLDVDGEVYTGIISNGTYAQTYEFGFEGLQTPQRNLHTSAPWTYCDDFIAIVVCYYGEPPVYPTMRMYSATLNGPETWRYGQWPKIASKVVLSGGNEIRYDFRFATTVNNGGQRDNGAYRIYYTYYYEGAGQATTGYQDFWLNPNNTTAQLIQLTPSHARPNINYNDPSGVYSLLGTVHPETTTATQGNNMYYKLVRVRAAGGIPNGNRRFPIEDTYNVGQTIYAQYNRQDADEVEQLKVMEELSVPTNSLSELIKNIYDLKIKYSDHMPNITNAEMVGNLCKMFGLAMFYNAATNVMQLSFFKDLINSNYLDISEYITEAEKYKYEPGKYELKIDTCKSQSFKNKDFEIDDVTTHTILPPARRNKRRVGFVANENATRISEQDSQTFEWKWERGNGNNHTLTVGDSDEDATEVKPNVKVTNMRRTDPENSITRYIAEVDASGNSKMFDNDYTGEFEMVLTQYKGKNIFPTMYANIPALRRWFEEMNPTCYDSNGNPSDKYLSLTATGENSVGEKYQQPLFDFLAQQEKFRFTAVLPMHVFLEVYKLMQPQDLPEAMQTRWLMIHHRRYLPQTITYTLSNGKVVAQIECSRYHTANVEETLQRAMEKRPVEVWNDNDVWDDGTVIVGGTVWNDNWRWDDDGTWTTGTVYETLPGKKIYLWDDFTVLRDTVKWTDGNEVTYKARAWKDTDTWRDSVEIDSKLYRLTN